MRDPRELFVLRDVDVPGQPVLLHALESFDPGGGVRLACQHLVENLPAEVVATFELDELFDYRARRPLMIYDTDRWDGYTEPKLELHMIRDERLTPFLLLAGPEPDFQWERFAAAVRLLVDRLSVSLAIGLHSVRGAVPHTRPVSLSVHGRPLDLLARAAGGPRMTVGRVHVPGMLVHLLEYRLGVQGLPSLGLSARVPHYLGDIEFPDAAEALLAAVGRIAELSLPLEALHESGAAAREHVDEQVRQDEQVASAVHELEERYDEFARGETRQLETTLPTGDELAAAFERFLAERPTEDDEDEPDAPD